MMDFIERLSDRLTRELPGETAQILMAPNARRHIMAAMPATTEGRQSAVLLYLFPRHDDWHIVLMRRPDYEGTHGGQVSIPGGLLVCDESHEQAALREFEEEIGISVKSGQLIGMLSDIFIPPSNYLVQPFVGYADNPPCYNPDPLEVKEIIELPIARLMSDATVKQGKVCMSNGAWTETPYFDVAGHMIWGATAMILSEFKEILRSLY